jgi:hypothetical protein
MVKPRNRIAVLGLYNSGSTVLAGMLHRLGVNMGGPFWRNSEDAHAENFYEARQLSGYFRHWFAEPLLQERTSAAERVRIFRQWAELQEAARPGPLGIKHPLLSLCASDLLQAWGPHTRMIRASRPLEESVHGLERRGWFPGFELDIQNRLWASLEAFEQAHPNVLRMDHHLVMNEPAEAARMLATAIGLDATEGQLQSAASLVRRKAPRKIAA